MQEKNKFEQAVIEAAMQSTQSKNSQTISKEDIEKIKNEILKEIKDSFGLVFKELSEIKNNQQKLVKAVKKDLGGGTKTWLIVKKIIQIVGVGIKKLDDAIVQTNRNVGELIFKDSDGQWKRKQINWFQDKEVGYLHDLMLRELANEKNPKARAIKQILADSLIQFEIREKGNKTSLLPSFSYGEWTEEKWRKWNRNNIIKIKEIYNEDKIETLTTKENVTEGFFAKPGVYDAWLTEKWKYFTPADCAIGKTKGQVLIEKIKEYETKGDIKKAEILKSKLKIWNDKFEGRVQAEAAERIRWEKEMQSKASNKGKRRP